MFWLMIQMQSYRKSPFCPNLMLRAFHNEISSTVGRERLYIRLLGY